MNVRAIHATTMLLVLIKYPDGTVPVYQDIPETDVRQVSNNKNKKSIYLTFPTPE